MNIKRYFINFLSALLFSASPIQAKDVIWFNGHQSVSYSINSKHTPVVAKALEMFSSDMKAVTGRRALEKASGKIEIWQMDALTDKEFAIFKKKGIPYEKIIAKKDAFYICVKNDKIEIVGSDGRGTAYGILELSRLAGVSPWIWWGDATPEKKTELKIKSDFITMQWPSVEYRGVFINDEDWSSRVWAHKKRDTNMREGAMGPKYYHMLFELLLRLRGNTLWPAMHNGTTAFFKTRGNKEVADSFDIYVGSSHCEPILRNNVEEWDEKRHGAYNWITNRKTIENYWRERARETASMDALYTIGMRGIHDGSMQGVKTMEEKVRGLQSVIDFQRRMLSEEVNRNLAKVPQVFIPYKEVLDIYEKGLKVPDDVTLMWCDDNYGYMTRLSDAQQQRRRGGGGVYYHLSYWGRPHDYLWLTTTQPGLLYNEMKTAYDHNCRRLWIANVHDPKVAAYDLSLFMDMAWNINCVKPNSIKNHLLNWLCQQFGVKTGQRLLPVMTEFYRLTAIRRPEFMGWNQVELDKKKYPKGWSPIQDTEFSTEEFGNELERYLNDYENIKSQVNAIAKEVRPELRAAYFAAIQYPVCAAAAMATKQLQAQESRHIARPETFHKDEEALAPAVRSWKAYQEILNLTDFYNTKMANGKWNGSMNCKPRNLLIFQEPSLPDRLTNEEIQIYSDYGPQPASLYNDGCIVRNACHWSWASHEATPIDMLGHSMKAVSLPKGGILKYNFDTMRDSDSCTVRLALIPTQANDKGDLRFSVSIDDGKEEVFSLKEPYRSEQWKQNVLRGQAIRNFNLRIASGSHTLTIKAIDDHIIIDQWMLDYNLNRHFYMFPIMAE